MTLAPGSVPILIALGIFALGGLTMLAVWWINRSADRAAKRHRCADGLHNLGPWVLTTDCRSEWRQCHDCHYSETRTYEQMLAEFQERGL